MNPSRDGHGRDVLWVRRTHEVLLLVGLAIVACSGLATAVAGLYFWWWFALYAAIPVLLALTGSWVAGLVVLRTYPRLRDAPLRSSFSWMAAGVLPALAIGALLSWWLTWGVAPLAIAWSGSAAALGCALACRGRARVALVLAAMALPASVWLALDSDTTVTAAAASGPDLALALLLRTGHRPDAVDERGLPALISAVVGRSEGRVEELLVAGADPAATDRRGETALTLALRTGQPAIEARLWAAGAPGDEASLREVLHDPPRVRALAVRARPSDATAILAEATGDPVLLDLLLSRGADPDGVGSSGRLPLNEADPAATRRLLAAGADPEAWDRNHQIPLYRAVLDGDPVKADLLVAAGAEVDTVVRGTWPETALTIAVQRRDRPMIELLLDHGASLEVEGVPGSALEQAAGVDADLVVLLIDRGADPRLGSPLWYAAQHQNVAAAAVLLERGARVEAQGPDGRTFCELAVGPPGDLAALAADRCR